MNPEVTRFFLELEDEATEGTLVLPVEDFETDAGVAATEFPELSANNSYYNCYINGVLQMEGITTYTPGVAGTGQLTITVGEDETLMHII